MKSLFIFFIPVLLVGCGPSDHKDDNCKVNTSARSIAVSRYINEDKISTLYKSCMAKPDQNAKDCLKSAQSVYSANTPFDLTEADIMNSRAALESCGYFNNLKKN